MSHGHNTSTEHRIIRQSVRSVACPKCGALPHQKCIGVRGQPRAASHQQRWTAWREKYNSKD